MGEGGTIGAPAAIANAVSDALAPLGLAIDELPITPQRLFRLLRSQQSLKSSCPDLTRASTKTGTAVPSSVDGRDKPGHDDNVD